MTSLIKHKRVEFTELFYDLVFVYAISKTTSLIHHLHNGIVTWEAFSAFLISLLLLVNTWMIQTVFTNRYGKNSSFNIIIMFINMALLTLISNMLVADWQSYFNIFTAIVAGLSFTLFLQYLVQYFNPESSSDDKNLIRGFLAITGIRTLSVFIASLLPVAIGFPIYVVGIVVTFLMPFTFSQKMNLVPINFPHLLERISLLVIITFGEMIMGVADFFTPETVNLQSILYFLIVVNLFMYYFGEFDHAIDESVDSQGMHLIYSHYPIFIGLIMVTVSMTFLSEHDANHLFVTGFLYAGLALFQWAVLSNTVYNKNHLRYSKAYIGVQAALFLLALVSSLFFSHQLEVVLYITTTFVFAIEIHFLLFYQKQGKIQQ